MNILITGANGQLGLEIREQAENCNHQFLFTDVKELDITKKSEISKFVNENEINIIVNCAAYTNVDKAEDERELSDLINRKAVENLVKICEENKVLLVHISTDYVFGGAKNTPYKETDSASPLGVYGKTKLDGEEVIKSCTADYLILRTSWLYSSYGDNFVKTIKRLSEKKTSLRVVFDQVGTPTYAADLARFIVHVINNGELIGRQEIYHFSNEGVCSWFDFAKEIVEESKNECEIIPCYSNEFPTKVIRPNYSVLDKTKLRSDFNYKIPHWRDSLKGCIEKLKA